jgi:serine O-acetyltransferase
MMIKRHSDLKRYGKNISLLKGLLIPGFHYTFIFRLNKKYSKNKLFSIFLRLYLRKLSFKYGFQIPISTKIGEGLYLGHFGPIIINEKAIIGRNCNIAHCTTIGQTNRGKDKGTPIIGDFVWIGTGSVIVGKIIIGNNVLIAPNTYVNQDIPSNSIVVGNPIRIINNPKATEGYINNTI